MKHTLLVRTLAATLLTTAAFAASAQSTAVQANVDASTQAQPAADAEARGIADAKPEVDRLCMHDTRSSILPREKRGKRCATFGRVYTSDDIQRTGAVDLGDALRKLDPAIR